MKRRQNVQLCQKRVIWHTSFFWGAGGYNYWLLRYFLDKLQIRSSWWQCQGLKWPTSVMAGMSGAKKGRKRQTHQNNLKAAVLRFEPATFGAHTVLHTPTHQASCLHLWHHSNICCSFCAVGLVFWVFFLNTVDSQKSKGKKKHTTSFPRTCTFIFLFGKLHLKTQWPYALEDSNPQLPVSYS